MSKKELFQKLDYKEQLEMILEKKSFPVDVKNLLLNILYKIDNSYKDYESTKRLVDAKNAIIEELLSIVSDCEQIETINPSDKRKTNKTKLEQKNKGIVVEPNEKSLLYALYNLQEEKKVYLSEEYSALRNALPYILKEGKNMHRAEIIRDFDGWAWNTEFDEVAEIESNLIYQNLLILFGKVFLEEWMNLEHTKNSVDILEKELIMIFGEDDAKEFIKLIFKLVIILFCSNNKKEQKRLQEELDYNAEEMTRLANTENLVKELYDKKTKWLNKIKKIDQILNNPKQLKLELNKENKKEKNKEEPLTEEELIDRLKKQRKKISKEIKEANKLLEPKNFINTKMELEKQNELLISIKEYNKKDEYLLELQKYFLKGLQAKIKKADTKKELMELVYLLRYYNFIPYLNNVYIKDITELKGMINHTEEILIDKLREKKMLNKFSNNEKFDEKLIKKVFKMRLINLENIYLEFQKGEKIRIMLYDVETIEKGFEIKNSNIKILKNNKKIKMFI